ncbi:hypothetical protein T484DRAFT_2730772 [Baffinella frigidus]|nr:hypothetical protein T484DRAFT_2730772 [Cryptophyta sp. CCMP2293]
MWRAGCVVLVTCPSTHPLGYTGVCPHAPLCPHRQLPQHSALNTNVARPPLGEHGLLTSRPCPRHPTSPNMEP